jgi:hypothetical protein
MASMVLGDSTLESLTPRVNAPLDVRSIVAQILGMVGDEHLYLYILFGPIYIYISIFSTFNIQC